MTKWKYKNYLLGEGTFEDMYFAECPEGMTHEEWENKKHILSNAINNMIEELKKYDIRIAWSNNSRGES